MRPATGPRPELTDGTVLLRRRDDDDPAVVGFDVVVAGDTVGGEPGEHAGEVGLHIIEPGVGELSWHLTAAHRRRGFGSRAVRLLVDWALTEHGQGGLGLGRVRARVDPRNAPALRVATRSGLMREGVERVPRGTGVDPTSTEQVLLGRLATDVPLSDPTSFRTLLNSFLPRKRGIAQMLVRDEAGRVLMCQLTYKRDWDLPGGVVEVGESPRLAVSREVEEELGLTIAAGDLLLTDWLPPWGGWDDALCLVFDGGTQPSDVVARIVKQEREIRDAQFLDPGQVRERATDFTARRVEAALEGERGYTESGR
ncbi:MAG: NUDIX hydrolase [Actinomycetota bacterium]|nr:NUDIX hydrolase [Actinomycetota bacterium]